MALARYEIDALMLYGDLPTVAEVLARFPPRPAWMKLGACRGSQPAEVAFFPARGQKAAEAKAVCRRCPVADECLTYALGDPELVGVWGGTTDQERRRARGADVGPAPAQHGPQTVAADGPDAE